VGKSSLFNALAESRISIVDPTAGVTRDRVATICQIEESYFELVDTGGHGNVDRDNLTEHVERQIGYAVDRATLILLVVDVRQGVTPLDRKTAELLRARDSHVLLLANKADEPHLADQAGEFCKLGFGDPLATSAMNGSGLRELRERILERIVDPQNERPADAVMRIAVVGKRNAGKSTFINALAGEERVIVSEVPGTTRDAIDVRFQWNGQTVVAIDTAGVRKKNKLADDIEFYAYSRVALTIRRADVVLFIIDAAVPVGQVDKRLARIIADELKPVVLVVNKWDLAKGRATTEEYGDYLVEVMPATEFAPVAFTTASTGKNVDATLGVAASLFKQAKTRVGTGKLNQALQETLLGRMPRSRRKGKRPKFFYATQVSTRPPTIVVFVNHPDLLNAQQERFLLNRLRERLPFDEIPIRLFFRARREPRDDLPKPRKSARARPNARRRMTNYG
jgi:GTP-binding protein